MDELQTNAKSDVTVSLPLCICCLYSYIVCKWIMGLNVLYMSSIRISLTTSFTLSIPPCLSFNLITLLNGLVAFGDSCWAEENGKCSERKESAFSFFSGVKGSMFFSLCSLHWSIIHGASGEVSLWRCLCVCSMRNRDKKRQNFPLQMDVGSYRRPCASTLTITVCKIILLSHKRIHGNNFAWF